MLSLVMDISMGLQPLLDNQMLTLLECFLSAITIKFSLLLRVDLLFKVLMQIGEQLY